MTMHDYVDTPIGRIDVAQDEGGAVTVSIRPNDPRSARVRVVDGEFPSLEFSVGSRPPRQHEEVTQNGHTFEVQGTRLTQTGKVQLKNEQGVWEDWVES